MRHSFIALIVLLIAGGSWQSAAAATGDEALQRREWTIDGVAREALVRAPAADAKAESRPLVFVFHGHGGTMRSAATAFNVHELWPEAVVVYMQGMNTPGRLTDPEGKRTGWQSAAGEQGDRDLKFFDAVLKDVRAANKIDNRRIYCTGHSNGGSFTYLLWATRSETFAAVAPSSAVAFAQVKDLKPKPVLHIAGRTDELVKFPWQERMIAAIRKLNGCTEEGKKDGDLLTTYPSPGGTPLVTYIHPGGHSPPKDVSAAVVKFFKEYARKGD